MSNVLCFGFVLLVSVLQETNELYSKLREASPEEKAALTRFANY